MEEGSLCITRSTYPGSKHPWIKADKQSDLLIIFFSFTKWAYLIWQGFSYHSEVETGGLLNLGKKAFGPSKFGKNYTGPQF